jgi:hypothetical protein
MSCGNSSKEKTEDTNDIQEMVDNICDAVDREDFEAQQTLCDDLYVKLKDINHIKAELWLSQGYFFICCYNSYYVCRRKPVRA